MTQSVLTGYRPTGKLHLGHLAGNLKSMLELQEKYDCYFFIADWHALTTHYADTSDLLTNVDEMLLDWLAAGLDPKKSVIYRQSAVPEIAELALYFSMITPLAWLERNPTYKEQLQELKAKEIATHGFLGYPVLQAADILSVHADLVPVGEDQLPHLELTREIARRFNFLYEAELKEPKAYLSKAKRLPGIDGRKMSKSYGNAIYLSDTPDEIQKKVSRMITDPKKIRRDDPGRPEVCNVFALHQEFSGDAVGSIADGCRGGSLGCVQDKKDLAERLSESLAGFRARRAELAADTAYVAEVLQNGAAIARPLIAETLAYVRSRVRI